MYIVLAFKYHSRHCSSVNWSNFFCGDMCTRLSSILYSRSTALRSWFLRDALVPTRKLGICNNHDQVVTVIVYGFIVECIV